TTLDNTPARPMLKSSIWQKPDANNRTAKFRARYNHHLTSSMSLGAGTRLGPYEILAPIGAGGMGEVYRAHDRRLGRDVAIKVLPPSLALDPDRLSRFEHETRVAGSLNHPNLVAI